jgi:hypothetical protein
VVARELLLHQCGVEPKRGKLERLDLTRSEQHHHRARDGAREQRHCRAKCAIARLRCGRLIFEHESTLGDRVS